MKKMSRINTEAPILLNALVSVLSVTAVLFLLMTPMVLGAQYKCKNNYKHMGETSFTIMNGCMVNIDGEMRPVNVVNVRLP